ncbi:AraC family ligand binding domain-containing protein, partial [Bordetella petrii]|uniref:AraC family ligand binding domain-containing protein n=1 Tax=Bordetella petrii TaxID=94624 RepID=UPI001E60350F
MSHVQFWRDSRLPWAESRRAVRSRACYLAHTHDTLSIGAVNSGGSVFSSGGATHRLRPGSLVMVPPRCVHACNPDPGAAWSYQMLHLEADWAHTLLQETAPAAGLPDQASISGSPAAYLRFCQLNDVLFSAAEPADKETALVLYVGGRSWLGRPPRAADVLPAAR